MFTLRAIGIALALAAAPALAQDKPMLAPPGQGPSGPADARAGPPPPDGGARDEAERERAREAAKAAAPPAGRGNDKDDDLERARAAARAADPRLQGLERAREAARAADPAGGKDCLSARDARGAIFQKRAVSLSQALRTARGAWDGEVIDYRLCTYDGALAYELTLLNADGRVARVRVDGASGKLVGVR